jgi:hypothetical protein
MIVECNHPQPTRICCIAATSLQFRTGRISGDHSPNVQQISDKLRGLGVPGDSGASAGARETGVHATNSWTDTTAVVGLGLRVLLRTETAKRTIAARSSADEEEP